MPKIDRLYVVSGIASAALAITGAVLFARQRRALSGLGRSRLQQAPIVNTYSDGNMRTTLRSSPNMPIEERVATIQDLVHRSVQDGEMRKLALAITRGCAERDKACEARAIYNYIKQNVRYTGDIGAIAHPDGSVEGIDLYQSARRTLLEIRGGDCDDHSIAAATLLALNGIDPILRIVKTRGASDWEHIYTLGNIDGKLVALDTTVPGEFFGKEPPSHKRIDFPA